MEDFHMEAIDVGGDHAVARVGGEIDVYTAPMLRDRVAGLVDKGAAHILVDMGGVDFLDSTGLGVLVACLKRARTVDGSLTLVVGAERIMRVFRITGLTKVFPIHRSVLDAVTAETHWRAAVETEAGSVAEWCRRTGLL